jgi:hypothetical protein
VGPDEAGMEGQLAEKRRRGRRQVGDGGVTHCPNRVTGRVIGDPNR